MRIGNIEHDYLDHDLEWVAANRTTLTDASLTPLLRALLRLRRQLLRTIVAIGGAHPLRLLTIGVLGCANPTVVRTDLLRLHTLCCRAISEIRRPAMKRRTWSHVVGQLLGGNRNRRMSRSFELLNTLVNIDDMHARLAQFYSRDRVDSPAYRTISAHGEALYKGAAKDVVEGPERRCERPLRDLLGDVVASLRMGAENTTVGIADYGCGVDRTRQQLAKLAPATATASDLGIEYWSLDVADHFAISAVPACRRCDASRSGLDHWLLVSDRRLGRVLSQLRHASVTAGGVTTWPARHADLVLLVNVLHEVPLPALPTLLKNIESLLKNQASLIAIYEMGFLSELESSFVLWQPQDVYEVFRAAGYDVICLPGRTRNPTSGEWGHKYLLGYARRTGLVPPALRTLCSSVVEAASARLDRLCTTVEGLRTRLVTGQAMRSEKIEHAQAIDSLANAVVQLRHSKKSFRDQILLSITKRTLRTRR